MSEFPPAPAASSEGESWVDLLSQFLMEERQVEAIRLNPETKTVTMATLGVVDEAALQDRLAVVLRDLDAAWAPAARSGMEPPNPHPAMLRLRHEGDGVVLEKPSCPTAPRFWKWREFDWPEPEEIEAQSRAEWQALAAQAAVCGSALAAGFLLGRFATVPQGVVVGCHVVSLVAGGWDAAKDTWAGLRERRIDVHFLMLAVALGAVAIGAWEEGALLLFLFSTSGALEHFVMHRTHREINALTRSAPKQARVLLPGGGSEQRNVNALRVDDLIAVRPDELFPVDGEVRSGRTAADESTLTGESAAIEKAVGDEVFGGTLNQWGLVTVRVTRPARHSALQKIIGLIQNAQHLKAPSQRFTDKFGTRYTVIVLGTVAIMFFVWWLGFGIHPFRHEDGSKSAFYRAMTLLVVMSPCALVLSIPSAILAAIAWGARRGILFRGGAAIEKLAEVDTVAMDKTGTLTAGELQVSQVESFPPGREEDVLQIAVNLEAGSNHPIARAISHHAKARGMAPAPLDEFQSITGQGLRGRTADGVSYAGRRELVESSAMAGWLKDVPDAPVGFSEVWVVGTQIIGRLLLRDEIRQGSRVVLERLAAEQVRTIMLTGDRRAAAAEVGRQLGIAEVRAGLHPEDKVAAILELTQAGHKVAMVGDGVNDAPSLAAAHVSVAMGARGSDAALEQSDVVLMQDRIEKLLSARKISAHARRIIRQNLAISLGSVIVMAVASLFGIVPLTLGVLTHEGSTVIVCLNSLRLLFVKEDTFAGV
jgi:Zn2+/Cd2+-exporting ATPase